MQALIKFGNEEHIKKIQSNGTIYLNPFEYFKTCEHEGRTDFYENINYLGQAVHCEFSFDGYRLSEKGGFIDFIFNAPQYNEPSLTHLYSMSLIKTGDEIRKDLKIFDDRIKAFGDSLLLIYDTSKFLERLNEALDGAKNKKSILSYQYQPIEYVDFSLYTGDIGAFRKANSYSYQKEWRIGIYCNKKEPFILKIGSLKDISKKMLIINWKNRITPKSNGYYNYEF